MPILESRLDPRDATFARNRDAMAALVADLNAKVAQVELGGGEAACAKHVARGKLLPRERVRALRAKSRFEYSPFSGISVSGAIPVCLNIAPSSTGRQSTPRPCFAASASIFCAARKPYGDDRSK
jgi:3-methylcrotonyl-CoA carboxylase beta subunit